MDEALAVSAPARGVFRIAQSISELCLRLSIAQDPVRILRTLGWEPEVRARFFAAGGRKLPDPTYASFDDGPVRSEVTAVRAALVDHPPWVQSWLGRICDAIEGGARMLAAIGTRQFFEVSSELYGTPRTPLADGLTTSLQLAWQLEDVLSNVEDVMLSVAPDHDVGADSVAEYLRRGMAQRFGEDAPPVEVVEHLSANALASPERVRVRGGARFTDRDGVQLLQHEAFIHVATSLNGRRQEQLPILKAGHPGTTRTQEGLAVFAEMITGSMDPTRLRRLAGRIRAIQMAIEGASFLDVYDFFMGRTRGDAEQAFENTRRVFRGAPLTGGAPFTKDVVYLDGLLRVHNLLRTIVVTGRADCLRLLFCGKLDLEDLPALCRLANDGQCLLPKYLPPWAEDQRFLVTYLAYSAFLNRVKLDSVQTHYRAMMADAPRVEQYLV